MNDPELPLFNRSIGGLYHPGSVFKPLIAIAALEEGKIDKNYRYIDTGVVTVESMYGNFHIQIGILPNMVEKKEKLT